MAATDELDLLAHVEHHHGVFSRRTAESFGVERHIIDQRVRAYRWQLVQPSTLRVVGAPYTYEAEVLAAILSAREQRGGRPDRPAAAALGTCARLRGLDRYAADPEEDPVEITVEGTVLPELWWETVVHRTTTLPDVDVELVGAVPCTTGARFVIDHAALMDQVEVFRVVDDVIGGRHSTQEGIHGRAVALRAGRRHAALVRDVTEPGSAARFNSWLERTAAELFRRSGLPEARWNAPIYAQGEQVALADAFFERWRLIVELDGMRFHSEPGQISRDRARDRRLGILGYLVLRYSYWEVVQQPAAVVAEIREAIDGR